jgi:hypothetical protein
MTRRTSPSHTSPASDSTDDGDWSAEEDPSPGVVPESYIKIWDASHAARLALCAISGSSPVPTNSPSGILMHFDVIVLL